jgi:hypothetical protein
VATLRGGLSLSSKAPTRDTPFNSQVVAFHPTAPFLVNNTDVFRISDDCTAATLVATLHGLGQEGGHKDLVLCFAFHPTAPVLASVGRDATVKLWR